eukprot:9867011-Alexandrium_andersonii.AAC.1
MTPPRRKSKKNNSASRFRPMEHLVVRRSQEKGSGGARGADASGSTPAAPPVSRTSSRRCPSRSPSFWRCSPTLRQDRRPLIAASA